MSLYHPKRSKGHRAVLGGTNPDSFFTLPRWLNNRQNLARIALTLGAIVLMIVVLRAWDAPFTYRRGDQIDHGISAQINFKIVDQIETDRARREASNKVPFLFTHHTENLDLLTEQFKAALGTIAEASDITQVPEEIRNAFGLNIDTDKVSSPEGADQNPNTAPQAKSELEANFEFEHLKRAVLSHNGLRSDTQITEVLQEFSQLMAPVIDTGIIDPDDVQRLKINLTARIGVINDDTNKPDPQNSGSPRQIEWTVQKLTDARMSDLLNDAGIIGQNWRNYPRLEPIRTPMETWLRTRISPTLKYDPQATQNARKQAVENVPLSYQFINEGDVLVYPGGNIDPSALIKLWEEYQTQSTTLGAGPGTIRVTMVFILLVLMSIITAYLFNSINSPVIKDFNALAAFLGVMIFGTLCAKYLSYDPFRAEMVPVIVTVMVYAIVYGQSMAAITAVIFSLIVTLTTRIDANLFAALLGSSLAAISVLRKIQSRSSIMISGMLSSVVFGIIAYGLVLLEARNPIDILSNSHYLITNLRGSAWCFIAGFLVAGGLPFIEWLFGIVTGISLLELGNPSHPLLRELVQRAPGTYNHSISVASIAENAAINIGANGLLVRIGSYFHDIGKIPKAEYFVENSKAGATSRHQHLAPAMSTLIIIGHVKDGVDLAEQYHLPRPLIDFIEQHHGTTLVEYFYHQATEKAGQNPDYETKIEESSFRYPGPKPQSREAGVLMLADAVESASRALQEPTPKRIERLVHDITLKKLLDGQFDESGLTLNDIRIIEKSLVKSLTAIHHVRIAYPETNRNAS
jgi:hypothetical protein